jgi:signal transduction histidine kinase
LGVNLRVTSATSGHRKTLLLDILILSFCLLGVYNIINKSALPIGVLSEKNELYIYSIGENSEIFRKGDLIFNVSGLEVRSKEELEILLDGSSPGDRLSVSVLRDGEVFTAKPKLVSFYSSIYIIIAGLVGISFFLVAIIVLLKCENNEVGKTFHWAFVFTGMIILMTWGNYSILPLGLGKITRIGFHAGYLFAPLYFLRFSTLFPSKKKILSKNTDAIIRTIAQLLFIALSVSFYWYSIAKELSVMRAYIMIFDISSIFIVLLIISAILIFIHSYRISGDEADRRKLRWIILGFLIGPLGYLIFWVIPSRIWGNAFLPEEVILILVAFVPITFGTAIIKYRLMNIDLIFKRSIVYSVVLTMLLVIYIGIISIATYLANNPGSEISSLIAAICIALLFQPAKTKVQKLVDKKFFRIAYDYRIALNRFISTTKDIFKEYDLFKSAVDIIDNIIPVDKIGIFKYDPKNNTFQITYHKNYENLANDTIVSQFDLGKPDTIPYSDFRYVEAGVKIDQEIRGLIKTLSARIIFGINSSKYGLHAILVIGEKRSGRKFSEEDIDLIRTITNRLSLTLDRIRLQEEVIMEHMQTERLEDLNKLKSFFVSSVSHDLKTPLTSIRLFAERLKTSKNLSKDKVREYLDIIEGESGRLTRLINNVLDYSKIERGIQSYNLRRVSLNDIIRNALKIMDYQLTINGFNTECKLKNQDSFILGDGDAIEEAILNLLSNAVKFSGDRKVIAIISKVFNDHISVEIIDSGKGIDNENLQNIFEPFFRCGKISGDSEGGAGLGLAIVKHIMDAHNGKIEVESKPGKGSTFRLLFPTYKSNNVLE